MKPDTTAVLGASQARTLRPITAAARAFEHSRLRGTSAVAPGWLWLLPCVLMISACGGGGDTPAADVSAVSAASPVRPEASVSAVAATPAAQGRGDPATVPHGVPAPLHAWLHQWATRHGATATVAPGIADRMVALPVDAATSTDAMLAAVADASGAADVVLSFSARAGGPPSLAAVAVHGPGDASRARLLADRDGAPTTHDAMPADPAQAVARLAHDLASPAEPARRQALARSFEIDAPLPLQALLSAAQGDRSGTVRRYALMALERHPEANPAFLRTLVDRARADADPKVRRQAAEIEERLDADGMSAEVWPGH